ncbi:unnamed protein product [Polarella glacialis]|uniref:CBS domain-containing protein n=1 Tax=Polarella glacialis TaxID=89957 RepID=A0A813IPU9_POLGL|nr:unnamed protein product [Polarella glacialis]
MLPHDRIISHECVEEIMNWGHSRLFVYRRDPDHPEKRDDIIGVILVKKLLNVSLDANCRVDSVLHALKRPVVLHPEDNLLTTLNKFQAGTCHLAVISPHPDACLFAMRQQEHIPQRARPTMFCSLEDVIEEMLKEEIYDEEDKELGRHTFLGRGDSSARSHRLMLNLKLIPRESSPSERGRTRLLRRSRSMGNGIRRSMSECDLKSWLLEEGLAEEPVSSCSSLPSPRRTKSYLTVLSSGKDSPSWGCGC